MSVINTQPLAGSSGNQATGYNLTNSLRFRSTASAYLSRTPASVGNRKTWTWSGWVKRGSLGSAQKMFSWGTPGTEAGWAFEAGNTVEFYQYGSGAYQLQLVTSQVFRDVSSWYHIIVAVDTTQATASNRTKLYVNGTQVTGFSTATYPTQNLDTFANSTSHAGYIGGLVGQSVYLDGYLDEVNFVDGQQLTPSSFGENDLTTGVWKPKRYAGTYGTNGFYLPFTDVATTSGSNAGLGKDFSGNGNYWNTTNISVTSGATYDSMTDVPTLTSATVANYCTLNPLDKNSAATVTNGNLTGTLGSAGWASIRSTIGMSSGKWYCEVTQSSSGQMIVGISTAQAGLGLLGTDAFGWGYGAGSGLKYTNGAGSAYGAAITNGDVVGIAFDQSAGTLTFYKNGTSQGTAFTSLSTSATYFFTVSLDATIVNANFGQRPFAYTPPSGFKALNTYNLPDSTIVAGNKYMDATTYTGNGSTQSITNAGGFKPDLVWLKARSAAYFNNLNDSVRGVNNRLFSNNTDAQDTTANCLTAFNTNGFAVGTNTGINENATTFVGWQWQAGQSAGSSNTNGSITSTVSVNAAAGFSVATYAGTGANATVGHGLGVAAKFMIVKNRTLTDDWCVYHASSGATNYGQLNLGGAFGANSTIWNNTAPTSSVFSVGTYLSKSGSNYVAYCWSEIEGFSKMGSYTGNGSTDGPFVYTGFRPKFILTKRTDATSDWWIQDTARSPRNASNALLFPNLTNAEYTTAGVEFDILSNGFKPRNTGHNISSGTYIYMAFAENPFKNSLAR